MRVIVAPFDLQLPLTAFALDREGEAEFFDRVSLQQLVAGLDKRRQFAPTHVYLGSSTAALDIAQAVTIRRNQDTPDGARTPSLPISMELHSRELWAAVAFLSGDIDSDEKVALVLPEGISTSAIDGLEPLRATSMLEDGSLAEALPSPTVFRQGELLLWDWLTKLHPDLGIMVDEDRVEAGSDVAIALLLAGVEEGHRILTRYRAKATERVTELLLEIVPEGEPQSIAGKGGLEGTWDVLLEPEDVLEDGGVIIGEGVRLSPVTGLHKRSLMVAAREPELAGQGGE